ncbi:DUF5777 family beta-barrel protein [Mangrovimonas aestuarii]|uniref:DUF5777 family beta-barrel protein n=1 Tax=Mangrovimonas aestuarii TaxID=3018443 RepID=UPI002379649D|nr:DUF5777 family beta-barrel protein [Mangrovimonas aestuarii]
MKNLCLFLILILIPFISLSQDDLLDEIDSDSTWTIPESAVFKGLKIVNFESTKLATKKELIFNVAHRFGSVKYGLDTFFGLDDALTRLNFIYGICDGFNISLSRSSYQKTYEGALKYRLLTQEDGEFPFTVVGYNSLTINTALEKDNLPKLEFVDRLGYTTQLLVSRKVNTKLSLELAPTFIHNNYVVMDDQSNSQFALGVGGRYKLGNRWSVNADYGYNFSRASDSPYRNPLSIGVDIETGGHVFQLLFSNAQPMNTNAFLTEASGDWGEGDIFFGFNLTRVF